MTSFTVKIGKLRIKKYEKTIEAIQKKFPEYHTISTIESEGWFAITFKIWVREPYHVSNVLHILDSEV